MMTRILIFSCVIKIVIGKNSNSKYNDNHNKKIFVNLFKKDNLYEDSKDLLVESFLETYQLLKDPQLNYFQRLKITQYLQKLTLEMKKYIYGKEENFYTEILARGYRPYKEKLDVNERQPFKWGR